jgi:tRNA threonylcarbamoyladenosine biosynthesis protein TsaB
MTILNIETSTPVCSVSLDTDDAPVASRCSEPASDHARILPLYVSEVLHEAEERGLHIDAVAVSSGPGSYTGLRIGVSMAKGLAYGLHVPLVAVPTLQLLAAQALAEGGATPHTRVCPMLDARRMEVYAAVYDSSLHETVAAQALVMDEAAAADLARQGVTLACGDGADKCRELLEAQHITLAQAQYPDARFMYRLAEMRLKEGRTEDVAYFEPFYLKEFTAAVSHVKGLK